MGQTIKERWIFEWDGGSTKEILGRACLVLINYDSRCDRQSVKDTYAAQYAIRETDKRRLHMTTNAGSSRAHWFFVSAKEKIVLF